MKVVEFPVMEVTSLLNDWYLNIKFQNVDEANRLKEEIDNNKEIIERDQTHMIYYMLLDFRHKLLLRQYDQAAFDLTKIETKKDQMDGLLTYYYLFFKGNYEYSIEQYEKAIESYQLAEQALENVPDDIEHAEFHYKVASAYYQVYFATLAEIHAEKAFEILQKYEHYIKRFTDCHVLLAMIYADLGKYGQALSKLQEALMYAKKINAKSLISGIIRNLGWLYSKAGQSEMAIEYLETSLQNVNRLDDYLKTLYLLAKEYFKIGEFKKGFDKLTMGKQIAEKNSEKVLLYRFKILEAFNVKQEEIEFILPEAINYFKRFELWEYVEGYSLDLAEYYGEKGNHQKASEWLLNVARTSKLFATKSIREVI
ncbi:tetratricopeptide repeat protein [Camelliibacillus cellulosilyticus]|uniref:Tetratricopeptide repeat protein n=1 Tax=Camelliibacillus cellulosilyticus TaxID=2174486 RepID=A0ABV9GM22_9BACL